MQQPSGFQNDPLNAVLLPQMLGLQTCSISQLSFEMA